MQQEIGSLKEEVGGLKEEVGGLKEEVGGIRNQMVTKSYLDEKLADLSGDVIIKLRKEDAKVNRLVEILKRKEMLTDAELKELAEYQIFPKYSN